MDRSRHRQQTKLDATHCRGGVSVHRTLRSPRSSDTYNNKSNNNNTKRHRYNLNFQSIKQLCLLFAASVSVTPVHASDVGGVSATASPIANSSGSVTNQAIQVLQGPYITNTYGGGISCQGATMNLSPFFTGSLSEQHPYEDEWMDPVYNNLDANDDGVPDNPGQILYYKPVKTNQKDSTTVSLGVSATWSKPLYKKLQEQCKQAAAANINLMNQAVANKRLDFEIARLKNCGELMKAGIIFKPGTEYAKVCADVILINPPGVVANHTHKINTKPPISNDASILKTISIGDK